MSVQIDRSLRLPETEYFPSTERKTGIAIHHTVGGSAASTIRWWREDVTRAGRPSLTGTAYVVDRDGTVFEAFAPEAWAYQFGVKWPAATRLAFERRFVGIEIASEGALIERDGSQYCFDRVSPRTMKAESQAFDFGRAYRGYRWFDRYEDEQLTALGLLVDELCHRFGIARRFPDPPFDYYGDALLGFEGVIGHANVRRDKSDPAPDPRLWDTLVSLASVKPAPGHRWRTCLRRPGEEPSRFRKELIGGDRTVCVRLGRIHQMCEGQQASNSRLQVGAQPLIVTRKE